MSTTICRSCLALPCVNPNDLAAGIDGAIYSALDFSFVVGCPPTCFCPPGLFPRTISILSSTIPPVIPPILEPGTPIILRLQGCTSLITRTLVSTATQAQIVAAAQSMQAEWAGQQALCNALLVPGVNCNTGSGSISVCNDAQTICCPGFGPIFIAANQFCQDLNITGLNQVQIDAATAVLKANLNAQAIDVVCPGLRVACVIQEVEVPPFSGVISLIGHNQSATVTFDSSTFQVRDNNGVFFTSLQPTIAPLATVTLVSFSGPSSGSPFSVYYQGVRIFNDPNPQGAFSRAVHVFVGCAPIPPPC